MMQTSVWWCLALGHAALQETPLNEVFRRADQDANGVLELREFETAIAILGSEINPVGRKAQPPQVLPPPPPPPKLQDQFHSVPVPQRFRGDYALPKIEHSGFYKAFVNSLGMIWATELGDKTFFIAAVLAMRNSRLIVFSGALTALAIMTVLSAALGYALPSLLPRKYTHYASAALFLYFGTKMLRDASHMSGDGPSDDLVEVEDELMRKKAELQSGCDMEVGSAKTRHVKPSASLRFFSQACVLTFLAEWGDRSQIATIALAAAKDPYGVILGGITGHTMCTGLAVIGGRMLASRISERTVSVVGGLLFLVFSLYAFLVEDVPHDDAQASANILNAAVAAGSKRLLPDLNPDAAVT